jgi:hypothetical protein
MTATATQPQPPAVGDYVDRKRTLPRRVVKLSLRLASLPPGEYVLLVRVPEQPANALTWREAVLAGGLVLRE